METSYRNVHWLFVSVLFIIFAGFFFTYFIKFPRFEGISGVKHFHGISFLLWFGMLIAQPILIKKGKLEQHRLFGKLSYVLAPLIVVATVLVGRDVYYAILAKGTLPEAIGTLSLNLPGTFIFAACYALAIFYRKNRALHMRFMICTVLPLLGPGLVRALIIFGKLPFPVGVAAADYTTIALAIGLIIYDWRKGKNFAPYAFALALNLMAHFLFDHKMGAVWQAIGGAFARLFF